MSHDFKNGERARVAKAHQSTYPDPLVVAAGDRLDVGERDSEWPEFVWCTTAGGRFGWVPERFLEIAGRSGVVRRAYSAHELTARLGEPLTVIESVGGWVWASNASGEAGWVPETKIEKVGDCDV